MQIGPDIVRDRRWQRDRAIPVEHHHRSPVCVDDHTVEDPRRRFTGVSMKLATTRVTHSWVSRRYSRRCSSPSGVGRFVKSPQVSLKLTQENMLG